MRLDNYLFENEIEDFEIGGKEYNLLSRVHDYNFNQERVFLGQPIIFNDGKPFATLTMGYITELGGKK